MQILSRSDSPAALPDMIPHPSPEVNGASGASRSDSPSDLHGLQGGASAGAEARGVKGGASADSRAKVRGVKGGAPAEFLL